jgi:hypothetical protein
MNVFASISLAVGVAVAVAASSPAMAGGSAVAGSWSGEMRQIDPDGESKYPMTLVLQGTKGTSSYPTLKCGGTWSRIGETKDGYVIYKEKVANDDGGSCIDGVVIVRVDAGKLILGWFAAFEGTPSLASAVLEKEAKQ